MTDRLREALDDLDGIGAKPRGEREDRFGAGVAYAVRVIRAALNEPAPAQRTAKEPPTLAVQHAPAIDVEALTKVIVDMEENRLCSKCVADVCDEHEEFYERPIGCGDAAEIARRYAEEVGHAENT